MIKNERQYRITKAQADKFEKALAGFSPSADLPSLIARAQRDALASQLQDLREEIHEYDALRSGKRKTIELTSFDDLPRALIQSRIALGLSQKKLADRLGINEQQLQRYEATEYSSASIGRVKQIIDALGISVREQIVLRPKASGVTKRRKNA